MGSKASWAVWASLFCSSSHGWCRLTAGGLSQTESAHGILLSSHKSSSSELWNIAQRVFEVSPQMNKLITGFFLKASLWFLGTEATWLQSWFSTVSSFLVPSFLNFSAGSDFPGLSNQVPKLTQQKLNEGVLGPETYSFAPKHAGPSSLQHQNLIVLKCSSLSIS